MKSALAVAGLGLFLLTACTDGVVARRRELAEPATASVRSALDTTSTRDAPIALHTATLLADATVLLAGGRDTATEGSATQGKPRKNAWLYVSSEVGLTPLPDLVTARAGHTATRLWDGTVLIAGGFDSAGNALESTELFVPGDSAFVSGPNMLWAHGDGTATLLEDGRVLLVGGYDDAQHEHPSAGIELYDPPTQTFTTVPNPRRRSGGNVAVTLADGTVAIHWSDAGDPPTERFEPRTSRLSLPEPPLFAAVSAKGIVTATRLPSGSVALLDNVGFHVSDPSGQCAAGSGLCNGQCTSLTTVENCGACGNACPIDADCIDSECSCNTGTLCAGGCRDVYSDAKNCGSCDNACGAGQRCVAGQCEDGCGALTDCSGECVDTLSDVANCGACGHACGEGPAWSCLSGACSCSSSYYGNVTLCGSSCTNLYGDHDHCGSCDHACAPDELCQGGTCTPIGAGCPPETRCGNECVNFFDDPDHCGSCDHACANSEACSGGVCRPCPSGTLRCGEGCIDPFADPQNCGGCGNVCNGVCSNGTCQTCPPGQQSCYGQCRTNDTPTSCGACDRQCAAGFDCVNGDCALSLGIAPTPALSADSLWTTEASVAMGYPAATLEGVAGASSGSGVLPPQETFGSRGHTTTALPDGSLLVVGGDETPRALRVYPGWTAQYYLQLSIGAGPAGPPPGGSVPAKPYPDSALTTLLPDGRLLILAGPSQSQPGGTDAHLYDGKAVGPPISLPWAPPVGAAVQSSGKVLLLHRGGPAALFDADTGAATGLELASSLASRAEGTSIALPGGGLLVAGHDGVDVLSPPAGKTIEVAAHPLDIGCDAPSITRLANGHALVVGKDRLYEIDPQSGAVTLSTDLILPRCHGTAITRRDGTVLIIGGVDDVSNTASVQGETYDPAKGATKRWSLETGTAPVDAQARTWFDEPLLLGGETASVLLDWQSSNLIDAQLGLGAWGAGDSHLTADGAWLVVASGAVTVTSRAPRATALTGAPRALTFPMADSVDFDATFPGHPFPGRAPEGSSGTTQSSPTNLPIPVWFPAEGGWPSIGTLTRSGSTTTYRVPSTPFPGLGLLFLAVNGDLTPLGPVTIAPSQDGIECEQGGECASGHCVDGVCCNDACDGTCEACSSARKGTGKNGECASVTAGTPDDGCRDDVTTCGENGTCDGSGHCALYPEGTECGPDATCRTQPNTGRRSCVGNPPAAQSDGSAGAAPDMGSAGTPSDAPHSTCDADERVVSPEGTPIFDCKPYRCRNAECVRACDSTRDCANGYACDSGGRCVHPLVAGGPGGCGCNVPRRSSGQLMGAAALLVLLARRRRSGMPS